MDDLRRLYRDALRIRLEALAASRSVLVSAETGQEVDAASLSVADAATAARRIAHALRGSGGTYGFPEVTQAAAAVEDATPAQLVGRLDALMQLLRSTIDNGAA
jgi:HPt (histidine-containing phosphotransfer) domain-containing protein